jgi:hypothetical protein
MVIVIFIYECMNHNCIYIYYYLDVREYGHNKVARTFTVILFL